MDFELQNLRDTPYNRQVCDDAADTFGSRRFSWKTHNNAIWVKAKNLTLDEYRNFLKYLK